MTHTITLTQDDSDNNKFHLKWQSKSGDFKSSTSGLPKEIFGIEKATFPITRELSNKELFKCFTRIVLWDFLTAKKYKHSLKKLFLVTPL